MAFNTHNDTFTFAPCYVDEAAQVKAAVLVAQLARDVEDADLLAGMLGLTAVTS